MPNSQIIVTETGRTIVVPAGPVGPPGPGSGGTGGSGVPVGGVEGDILVKQTSEDGAVSWVHAGTAVFADEADLLDRANHTGPIQVQGSSTAAVGLASSLITDGGTIGLGSGSAATDFYLKWTAAGRAETVLGELAGRFSKHYTTKTADHTFALADAGSVVVANKATTVTFTIPAQADVAWLTPTEIVLGNVGAGDLVVAGAVGVTVYSEGLTIRQGRTARLVRTGTNKWICDTHADDLPEIAAGPGIALSTSGSVTTISIPNGAVTRTMLADPTRLTVTATAYTTLIGDWQKVIIRNNASASTHKWPADAAADIPLGASGIVLNVGAGTVTHSADTGAMLVSGSAVSQLQGQIVHWVKSDVDRFILTVIGDPAKKLSLTGGTVTGATSFTEGNGQVDVGANGDGDSSVEIFNTDTDTHPLVRMARWAFGGIISFGPGLTTPLWTSIFSGAAGVLSVVGSDYGFFKGGHMQDLTAITATDYVHTLAACDTIVTRNNASASTHKFPSDATAAIPVGATGRIVNLGVGIITISADTGATLVTGFTATMAQGAVVTWVKTAANTFAVS